MSGYTYCEQLSCYVNKQYYYELDMKAEILKHGVLKRGKFANKPVVKVYKGETVFKFIITSNTTVWDPKKVWLIGKDGNRVIPKHKCSKISFKLEDIDKFLID